MHRSLFELPNLRVVQPFKTQLLKWVGNKQRFAYEIASYFPAEFGTYFEPFLGSGAVLATLTPRQAVGSDCSRPLMEIWKTLKDSPETLKHWYQERWNIFVNPGGPAGYERIKAAYNAKPNGADLLFLCRSCYGGVVRFRKRDGHMSTPCGIHNPIKPDAFAKRVDEWHDRVAGTNFRQMQFEEAMNMAQPGDLVYCDPPYTHSQAILYGAQDFSLEHLLDVIDRCKSRGVQVALSIDGTKKSGLHVCKLPIPEGLFEREASVNCGRSMLKRFQMSGRNLKKEEVSDRLLLTY